MNAPKKSYSSIGAAIKDNNVPAVKELLVKLDEQRRSIQKDEWTTLLFKTMEGMKPETAQFLIDQGANPKAWFEGQDQTGYVFTISIGQAAIMSNNRELVEWMLEKELINEKTLSPAGDNVIAHAVRNHAFEIAEMFVERGISIDHQNMRGITALHEAATSGDYLALEWLLDRHADPTLETIENAVACELVPDKADDPMEAEMLFQALDEYFDRFRKADDKTKIQTPPFITKMAAELKEKTDQEAQAKPPAKRARP